MPTSKQHSGEPWHVDPIGAAVCVDKMVIAFMHGDNEDQRDFETRKADARRIVACVNACAGISTADLEHACKFPSQYERLRILQDKINSTCNGDVQRARAALAGSRT